MTWWQIVTIPARLPLIALMFVLFKVFAPTDEDRLNFKEAMLYGIHKL